MDIEKVFHMTGGAGETSYSRNSSLQRKASDKVKLLTLETIEEVHHTILPKSIGIADLGCSSGPNTFSTIGDIVETIEETCRRVQQSSPEFRIYLNDLPTNDFNAIFQALPEFYKALKKGRIDGGPAIYIAGFPGSFYGRLFPDKCLHFIYSSLSLHWLSKVPSGLYDEGKLSINRGSIYISEHSPPQVSEAYSDQFRQDFLFFLRSRSEELVRGGKMVLILLGREGPDHVDRGNSFFWELLTRAFCKLVDQGQVEKEKIDSYEIHFYAPSKEELEIVVTTEGSFKVDHLQVLEVEKEVKSADDGSSYGAKVSRTVRAIQESMIAHHFGEHIVDNLFEEYGRLLDEEIAKEDIKPVTLVVVLTKL